ncbi:TasA family protein [Bacillus rubiinfantis]|uniref:TasA family protein n=1 Tax=Bacillus rubiinfantis TaxID=1499680 RepID=UPI0005A7B1E7|nr:TasA family protein [Bacillus rubiinfantis]
MLGRKVIKFFIGVTILIFCFTPSWEINANAETQEIDIATSPEKVLFELSNLKPGDWAERSLTINNNGKEDFNYVASSQFRDGSKKFFNELLLTISAEDKVIFDGKLKDFNKLESRVLTQNGSEKLDFKIVIPEHLGNDFQGLGCEVQFKFYAEGLTGGVLPGDGNNLPETGTNMFNLIVAGVAFILVGSLLQFVRYWHRRRTENHA